jgi:hypothetical protein
MSKPIAARALSLSVGVLLPLLGCAKERSLTEKLDDAETAITDAEQSGAEQRDFVELESARRKLEEAENAERQQDYEKADRLADEAEIEGIEAGRVHHGLRGQR